MNTFGDVFGDAVDMRFVSRTYTVRRFYFTKYAIRWLSAPAFSDLFVSNAIT